RSMRWVAGGASTSACWPTVLLADGVALRNRCPQGQADPRAAIAGGASGVTMARAGPRVGLALDAMGRRLPGVDVPGVDDVDVPGVDAMGGRSRLRPGRDQPRRPVGDDEQRVAS